MFTTVVTMLMMTSVEVNSIGQPRYRPPDDIPTMAANGRDSCNLAVEMDRFPSVVDRCYTPLPNEPDILDLACFAVYDVLMEACERSKNYKFNLTGVGGPKFATDEFCLWAHSTNPVKSLRDGGSLDKAAWRLKLEQAFNNTARCPQLCQPIIFCQLIAAGYGIIKENHSAAENSTSGRPQHQIGVTTVPPEPNRTTSSPQQTVQKQFVHTGTKQPGMGNAETEQDGRNVGWRNTPCWRGAFVPFMLMVTSR